jgi:pyrroloquinoline quinone biosynthesis protein B
MRIQILGSAAGGGFPQWNCGCANCAAARRTLTQSSSVPVSLRVKPRTQTQIAVSADDRHWFLAGASPDLRLQIEGTAELHPRKLRDSPISGVVLASADIDHVLGLLLLRELQPLRVYATPSILRTLREENSMFGMLNRVEPQAVWSYLQEGSEFPLLAPDAFDSGLRCEPVFLSGRYPKYVKSVGLGSNEAVCGLIFTSRLGKRVAYLPAVDALTDDLLAKIEAVDLLLFDGTFWSDDELARLLGSGDTAGQMGHLPIEQSLRELREINAGRKMFIHINNTNPILDEAGPEYRAVRENGWEVAEDGWRVDL